MKRLAKVITQLRSPKKQEATFASLGALPKNRSSRYFSEIKFSGSRLFHGLSTQWQDAGWWTASSCRNTQGTVELNECSAKGRCNQYFL